MLRLVSSAGLFVGAAFALFVLWHLRSVRKGWWRTTVNVEAVEQALRLSRTAHRRDFVPWPTVGIILFTAGVLLAAAAYVLLNGPPAGLPR
jgi:hypothetical protein